MIIELKDRRIFCTPEEYREMLLKGLIGDGPIWTGDNAEFQRARDQYQRNKAKKKSAG